MRNYSTIQFKRKRNTTINLIYICNLAISSMNTKMNKGMGMENISRLVLYICMCACKGGHNTPKGTPKIPSFIQWEACTFLTTFEVWSLDFLKVEVHEKFEETKVQDMKPHTLYLPIYIPFWYDWTATRICNIFLTMINIICEALACHPSSSY